jgi:hypothetical protein
VALFAVFAVLGMASRSAAQTPSLDVFYKRLEPKDSLKYKWKGESDVCNIGSLKWEVPVSTFSTGGLDRSFTGYCSEVLVPIVSGKTYSFRQQKLDVPSGFGLPATPEGSAIAAKRATLLRELFGRYYVKNPPAQDVFAFQLAFWELMQEPEPAMGPVKFDLFGGDFQADYPKDMAPAYVLQAQKYIESLTGDDSSYYTNVALDGRELIILKGIENADGIVAQSQLALRYLNGGATGQGFGAPTASGGGVTLVGAPGAGAGGGGTGGGAGGGIFTGGGNGTDSGNGTGNGNGNGGDDTGGTGGGGNGGRPPVTPPPVKTPGTPGQLTFPTAVPAPAGLFLGLVAVVVLASRRVYTRLTRDA